MASISYLLLFFPSSTVIIPWILVRSIGTPTKGTFFFFWSSFLARSGQLSYGQWECKKWSVQSLGCFLKERGHISYLFCSSPFPFHLGLDMVVSHLGLCRWAQYPRNGRAERSILDPCITYGAENSVQALTTYFWTRMHERKKFILFVLVFYCCVTLAQI